MSTKNNLRKHKRINHVTYTVMKTETDVNLYFCNPRHNVTRTETGVNLYFCKPSIGTVKCPIKCNSVRKL